MSKDLGKLAQRYAKAFLMSAKEQGMKEEELQELATSIRALAAAWRESKDFSATILNPMFNSADRLRALEKIADAFNAPEILKRFLQVVFEHERIAALPEIAAVFSQLVDFATGVVDVEISVARELSAQDSAEIEKSLLERIQGKLRFHWSVEPELLGGMVVAYQGQVLDGSLSGRLNRIEKKLMGAG